MVKAAAQAVRIVRLGRRHLGAVVDGFNSGEAAGTTFWILPRSQEGWNAHFDTDARLRPKPRRFAILRGRKVVGTCGLFGPWFSGAMLGIAIFDPDARGRGIGTYAVRALCDYGFQKLRLRRIELGVYPDNASAIRVYEKCGFKREALSRSDIYHDGGWRDTLWMSLLRSEWNAARLRGGRR